MFGFPLRIRVRHILAAALFALIAPAFALAGSQSYTTPGTYTFTVPNYPGTLTVQVWGGGGSGGSMIPNIFTSGTASSFGTILAGGGAASIPTQAYSPSDIEFYSVGGVGGSASGGDVNIPGEAGDTGNFGNGEAAPTGKGGDAPNGGAGGAVTVIPDYPQSEVGNPGNAPGGGGSGEGGRGNVPTDPAWASMGGGGSGGYAEKTYQQGDLTPGSTIPVTVGSGGVSHSALLALPGGDGAPGAVDITWDDTTPSCSISFAENPLTDNSTTMSWTSSDATLFYINNVGYVSATGTTTVYSPGDYSGTVTGTDGTGSCPATLDSPSGNTCPDGSEAPNGDPSQCTCAQGNEDACDTGNSCPTGQYSENGSCVASCDVGYTQEGNSCVFSSCPAGYSEGTDQSGNPECTFSSCPIGFVQQGQSCVFSSCPLGYAQQGNACAFQGCPTGYTLQGSYCVLTPSAAPSGDIIAIPSVVESGNTTNLSWSAASVSSCSISGTNGDSWSCSGTSCNATTTEPSSAITSQTIYTLSCEGNNGSPVTDSATVTIVPVFNEH